MLTAPSLRPPHGPSGWPWPQGEDPGTGGLHAFYGPSPESHHTQSTARHRSPSGVRDQQSHLSPAALGVSRGIAVSLALRPPPPPPTHSRRCPHLRRFLQTRLARLSTWSSCAHTHLSGSSLRGAPDVFTGCEISMCSQFTVCLPPHENVSPVGPRVSIVLFSCASRRQRRRQPPTGPPQPPAAGLGAGTRWPREQ